MILYQFRHFPLLFLCHAVTCRTEAASVLEVPAAVEAGVLVFVVAGVVSVFQSRCFGVPGLE